jgi:hypothetical protein
MILKIFLFCILIILIASLIQLSFLFMNPRDNDKTLSFSLQAYNTKPSTRLCALSIVKIRDNYYNPILYFFSKYFFLKKTKYFFYAFWPFALRFLIFKLIFSSRHLLKKIKFKKYVFNSFVYNLYFLNTFLIKSMLMLFLEKKPKYKKKNQNRE